MEIKSNVAQVRSRSELQAEQTRFLIKVYNWMGGGLLLTGIIAYIAANVPAIGGAIFSNKIVFFGLIIAELVLVVKLARSVMKMSLVAASTSFIVYAILNGLTLSFIFIIYTQSSIASAFLVTAGTFGTMSIYGAVTKRDLTAWGSFFMMGLIGVIIASVVNIFLNSPAIYWATTYIGVLIFVGLTAYDTQKILKMNIIGNEGTAEDTKEAIRGALTLYLDFINLFLFMVRIMGNEK